MSDSKNGSKSNLNESNMPLLSTDTKKSEDDTPEKENIEMGMTEIVEDTKRKAKVGFKKPRVKCPGVPSMPADVYLHKRDNKGINAEIDLTFEDILAEPDGSHGFKLLWQMTFLLFTVTKIWCYRILALVLAVPAALIWAFIFSIITAVYVWILTPLMKIFDLAVNFVRRIINGLMRATVEPICAALGAVFWRRSTCEDKMYCRHV